LFATDGEFPIHAQTTWIIEKRELKSPKNSEWRGYVVKLAVTGSTLEINVVADQFNAVKEGGAYTCRGRFEDQRGTLRLMAVGIEPAKAPGA
jgi:hypothetical protein